MSVTPRRYYLTRAIYLMSVTPRQQGTRDVLDECDTQMMLSYLSDILDECDTQTM